MYWEWWKDDVTGAGAAAVAGTKCSGEMPGDFGAGKYGTRPGWAQEAQTLTKDRRDNRSSYGRHLLVFWPVTLQPNQPWSYNLFFISIFSFSQHNCFYRKRLRHWMAFDMLTCGWETTHSLTHVCKIYYCHLFRIISWIFYIYLLGFSRFLLFTFIIVCNTGSIVTVC